MKANELRLGIWVYLFGDAVQLTKDHLIYLLQKDGLPEPITLTPEWLLMFGFIDEGKSESKHHGNFFSRHIHDYKYCFAYAAFRNDWGFYQEYTDSTCDHDYGKKHFVSCGIQYVHQLQNLYFALTGEELTIVNQEQSLPLSSTGSEPH